MTVEQAAMNSAEALTAWYIHTIQEHKCASECSIGEGLWADWKRAWKRYRAARGWE